MTAEVVILNLDAVALAADSAVTIAGEDGQKIFTTANKIFQLSKERPIAVMIYGASSLSDLSWETIIKSYRNELGDRSFATVDGYVEDFFRFVRSQVSRWFPEQLQADTFQSVTYGFIAMVADEIERALDAATPAPTTDGQRQKIADGVVISNVDLVANAPEIPDVPRDFSKTVRTRYGSLVPDVMESALGDAPVSASARRRLGRILPGLFTKYPVGLEPPVQSGLVFTGFGDEDVYPRLRHYFAETVVGDFVKAYPDAKVDIDIVGVRAQVVPFAQREMVVRFMEGVDPDYEAIVEGVVDQIVEDYPSVLLAALPRVSAKDKKEILRRAGVARNATMQTLRSHLAEVRQTAFWEPVAQLVSLLPKEELAAMAEALVNLTSFKRRVSWDAETVGGPIDVAVISRGDGFIWIKRKHYFDPALNPGFIAQRYGVRR